MATSFNSNLYITSAVGYRSASYAVVAPLPITTTTYTLNGVTQPDFVFTGTKIISVSSVTDFTLYPGSTSSAQVIKITNEGNSTVTLVGSYFTSSNRSVTPDISISPSSLLYSVPPQIPPGSTGTFTLAYYGDTAGEYANWIIILSDTPAAQYKFITRQIVSDNLNYTVSPTSYTTSITTIGERAYVSYQLTPVLNDIERPDIELAITYTLSGSAGWKVFSTGTNIVTLEFESNDINNINGSYSSSLALTALDTTANLVSTANVNIDYSANYNIIKWISPIAHHNSVIGISYDVIDNKKTLTIGVGMGGDNTPVYDAGGDIFLNMNTLGVGANNLDYPYSFWSEVYRFSNLGTGTAQTYLSGTVDADGVYLYRQKVTDEHDYGHYFGYERSAGSMFIVSDNGEGNLLISLNNLRELSSTDQDLNVTLDNFTRAFHYYSEKDIGERITNLIQYPLVAGINPITVANTSTTPTPSGETRTKFFRGFRAVSTATWTVLTSIVTIPK